MNKSAIIIGAGAQGKVILDILEQNNYNIVGFIDEDKDKINSTVNNIKVLGNFEHLIKEKICENVIIAIGNNKIRAKVFEECKKNKLNIISAIHPSAIISKNTKIGQGVAIMPGAIINTNTVIEDNTIINTKASIDHDCIIKKHAQIQPGATLTGTITINELSTVGSGATILPNITVEENSFVGAGAVVTKDIPKNTIVIGIPAKKMKNMEE